MLVPGGSLEGKRIGRKGKGGRFEECTGRCSEQRDSGPQTLFSFLPRAMSSMPSPLKSPAVMEVICGSSWRERREAIWNAPPVLRRVSSPSLQRTARSSRASPLKSPAAQNLTDAQASSRADSRRSPPGRPAKSAMTAEVLPSPGIRAATSRKPSPSKSAARDLVMVIAVSSDTRSNVPSPLPRKTWRVRALGLAMTRSGLASPVNSPTVNVGRLRAAGQRKGLHDGGDGRCERCCPASGEVEQVHRRGARGGVNGSQGEDDQVLPAIIIEVCELRIERVFLQACNALHGGVEGKDKRSFAHGKKDGEFLPAIAVEIGFAKVGGFTGSQIDRGMERAVAYAHSDEGRTGRVAGGNHIHLGVGIEVGNGYAEDIALGGKAATLGKGAVPYSGENGDLAVVIVAQGDVGNAVTIEVSNGEGEGRMAGVNKHLCRLEGSRGVRNPNGEPIAGSSGEVWKTVEVEVGGDQIVGRFIERCIHFGRNLEGAIAIAGQEEDGVRGCDGHVQDAIAIVVGGAMPDTAPPAGDSMAGWKERSPLPGKIATPLNCPAARSRTPSRLKSAATRPPDCRLLTGRRAASSKAPAPFPLRMAIHPESGKSRTRSMAPSLLKSAAARLRARYPGMRLIPASKLPSAVVSRRTVPAEAPMTISGRWSLLTSAAMTEKALGSASATRQGGSEARAELPWKRTAKRNGCI